MSKLLYVLDASEDQLMFYDDKVEIMTGSDFIEIEHDNTEYVGLDKINDSSWSFQLNNYQFIIENNADNNAVLFGAYSYLTDKTTKTFAEESPQNNEIVDSRDPLVEKEAFQNVEKETSKIVQEQELLEINNTMPQSKNESPLDNQRYEYKTEIIRGRIVTDVASKIEQTLNKYASEGWRLKSTITMEGNSFGSTIAGNNILIFEREIKK